MSKQPLDEYGFNPLKRSRPPGVDYRLSEDENYYFHHLVEKYPKFDALCGNENINLESKKAALKASPSVVSLVSYSGEDQLSQGCGTIIGVDAHNMISVLSSANIVRRPTGKHVGENNLADNLKVVVHTSAEMSYECEICGLDFHLNLLMIKFKSDVSLPAAIIRRIDDGVSFKVDKEMPFQLRPHVVKLQPGDPLVVVGRYFSRPFDLMVAPGCYSVERSDYDCKQLFVVNCHISECGDGAPVVNLSGEVIGISFYDRVTLTHCLPMSIALKWWDQYKIYGKSRHPRIGFEATSLFAVDVCRIERLIRRFPSVSGGIIVEKVIPGSSAHSAGLEEDDIIVKCNGKMVESFFELLEMMWDSIGTPVEMVVARDASLQFLSLKMVVEATLDELNRWPRWEP